MVTRLQWRRSAATLVVVAWLGLMLMLGASLLARHVVALPVSLAGDRLSASVRAMREPGTNSRWLAIHVLYSECRCSQRVVAHLLSSPRPLGWSEQVVWIGTGAPDTELAPRYKVRRVSTADAARLGIDSAPLLVIISPSDEIRYAGGYAGRKQGPTFDDLRIFAEAQRGQAVVSRPIFGCAVSERLRQKFSLLQGLRAGS
jgi:hypothetical protein